MRKYELTFLIEVENVEASNDEPAGYVATNAELGLVVEADSLDALKQKICEIAPDLFELNVLPKLRAESAKIPPAFVIHHAILSGGCDGEVLS